MSTSPSAVKTACSTSDKSSDHAYERKSDKPCLACGSEYVHSGGFCSRCYNLARKPKVESKKGDQLIAAVKVKLADTKSAEAKPAAKKRAASKAQPVTIHCEVSP